MDTRNEKERYLKIKTMENFFADETFCTDLESLMFLLGIGEDIDLPDDWTYKVECAELESMYQLDADKIADLLLSNYDDRYSEDAPQHDKVIIALNDSVDFKRLNAAIPKLWYPNGKFITITKLDLVEFIQ